MSNIRYAAVIEMANGSQYIIRSMRTFAHDAALRLARKWCNEVNRNVKVIGLWKIKLKT